MADLVSLLVVCMEFVIKIIELAILLNRKLRKEESCVEDITEGVDAE